MHLARVDFLAVVDQDTNVWLTRHPSGHHIQLGRRGDVEARATAGAFVFSIYVRHGGRLSGALQGKRRQKP